MLKKKTKAKKLTEKELGKMHKDQLDQAKAQFEILDFPAENTDGSIQVVATGKRVLKSITLDPSILNQEKDQIQESIVNVVNEALSKVREANIQLTSEVNRLFLKQVEQLKKMGQV